MLDDDKKKLIEAEESYRHQIAQKIRSEFQSAEETIAKIEKNFWGKGLEILNSNFGIWILSSVFISGGAAIYQIAQHHYTEKLASQKEILTCEFEIANRLNAMSFLLKKAQNIGDAQHALTPITKSFGAVTPEYEHVNIASLYFKYYQETGVRQREIEENVKELEEINLSIQQANPKSALSDEERNKMLQIISFLRKQIAQQINDRKG